MIRRVYDTFMKNDPRSFWRNWFDSRFYIAHLASKLNSELDYPYLLLLISGGHSQYLSVKNLSEYKRLGTTIDDALGDRVGILRMGDKTCLLDEALCSVALDLSGRGYSIIDMGSSDNEGEFSLDMGRHFYESLSANGRFGIHLRMLSGSNHHHILESSFKTFSRALREAASIDPRRVDSIASTKGSL